MSALLVEYAPCSTDTQDLTAQDGLTRRCRTRAGLRRPRTDRHRPGTARPLLPDARAIADELTAGRSVSILTGSVYDPHRRGRPAAVQRARHGR